MRRGLIWVLVGLLGVLLVIQLIPYGRAHTNPPALTEVQWNSDQTKALFARACADCHSHQTIWPWYSNVAPVSWMVQHDVDEGRARFNVSDRMHTEASGQDAADEIQEGAMPPRFYLLTHPEARLSAQERSTLHDGLLASLGGQSEHQEQPDPAQATAPLER